jgi:hypothetical protein
LQYDKVGDDAWRQRVAAGERGQRRRGGVAGEGHGLHVMVLKGTEVMWWMHGPQKGRLRVEVSERAGGQQLLINRVSVVGSIISN